MINWVNEKQKQDQCPEQYHPDHGPKRIGLQPRLGRFIIGFVGQVEPIVAGRLIIPTSPFIRPTARTSFRGSRHRFTADRTFMGRNKIMRHF